VVMLQSRDARALESCRAEMQQAGAALLAAMEEDPDGFAPALSPVKGALAPVTGYHDGAMDDSRFLYLGYMFEDEQDFNAFREYYTGRTSNSAPFEDAIPLSKPRAGGRNAILRLRVMGDGPDGSAWKTWYQNPSRIPMLYERSKHHAMRGAHVFFLDGHVEFIPHARTTAFPLTRGMAGGVMELDALQPETSQ